MFLFCYAIQQRNNIQRCKHKTMWVYPRLQFWFKDLAEEREKSIAVDGIVNGKK